MASEFLIAYDITCPRRLAKMHRYLTKVAVPIEYSVFFVTGELNSVIAILNEASKLIDKRSDDLRCYPLPSRGLKTRLGRATLPPGVFYSDLPAAWMGKQGN
jgi:CRISPR-associated protein Cas2